MKGKLIPNQKDAHMDFMGAKQDYYKDVCPYFEIQKAYEYIGETDITERKKFLIGFNDNNCHNGTFLLSPSEISDWQNLPAICMNNGLALEYQFAVNASVYLTQQYRKIVKCWQNFEYRHKKLGWIYDKEFDNYFFLYDDRTLYKGAQSKCDKDFDFVSGSADVYEFMLKTLVFPSKTLSLAYVIGFSSVVASLLKLKGEADIDTIILNISGKSSTGKSTVEQLMLSPFASPLFKKGNLGITHSGTLNGIIGALEGNHGLPRVIDDLTQNTQLNFTELIYTITQSETKMRLGTNWHGNGDWSGLVVISSETPILDLAKVQGGLFTRVLSARNIQWTESAEQAELIKKYTHNNYGHTGYKFIDYLCSHLHLITEKYNDCKTRIQKKITDIVSDSFTNRIVSKIAVIGVTCELVKDCFKESAIYEWTMEELMKPLIDNAIEDINERDCSKRLLSILIDYIFAHLNNFVWKWDDEKSKLNQVIDSETKIPKMDGQISIHKGGHWDVFILSSVLKNVLTKVGFNEFETAASILKERGVLIGDMDKQRGKMRNDKKVGCFHYNCFRISTVGREYLCEAVESCFEKQGQPFPIFPDLAQKSQTEQKNIQNKNKKEDTAFIEDSDNITIDEVFGEDVKNA